MADHLENTLEVKRRPSLRKFHLIYKTTCNITGRFYVGMHSTDNVDDDYYGSGMRIGRSLAKYGKENHTREILEFLPDRKSLISREEEIVTEELMNHPFCMNLMRGGSGSPDHVYGLTPESRKRISEASKRQPRTKERYEKVVQTRLENGGYQKSEEEIAKIKKALTGRTLSEEHKRKISEGGTGQKRSAETCANISASLKGKQQKRGDERTPMSAEAKENIRQARIGKKASEEARANMSKAGKERGARLKALHAADPNHIPVGSKRCTIDGVEIFNSLKDLTAKYGRGKNGARHPDFRYL